MDKSKNLFKYVFFSAMIAIVLQLVPVNDYFAYLKPNFLLLVNLGWIIFDAITTIRNSSDNSAIGRGVSILLAGICAVDALVICFFVPSLIAPCYLAQFFALILQKKFAAT